MEILAPAGNIEMLRAAVYTGADAVYLGLDAFNARIKAENFTRDNIADVTRFCHLHGVKVYVVINTSVKDKEKADLIGYIKACSDALVDAFIVSDIGIIPYFDKYAPNVPLHASTQLAIHNFEGAKIAAELGFSRIVVARETLLQDIRLIKSELDIEIEYFAHGALCVAFSGNCLFSSILSGNSGNRGRCLQPCRQKYTTSLSGKNGYLLSPKDQCLIEKLDDLASSGVDSLKIEGRLKSKNYVYSVVKAYRYALDNGHVDKSLYQNMMLAYNRGEFTKGYNYESTSDIMNPKIQGNIGISVGKIINSDKKSFEVKTAYPLKDKYGVKILSNTGEELGGLQLNNIKKTRNGYIVPSNAIYKVGSDVRLTLTEDVVIDKKRLPINYIIIEKENIITLIAKYGNISAEISENFDYAVNRATTKAEIIASLNKINDTEFEVNNIDIMYNNDLFIPKSMLNGIRRSVLAKLEGAILFEYNTNMELRTIERNSRILYNNDKLKYNTTVEIENEYMVTEYLAHNANIVINVAEICLDSIQSIINKVIFYNKDAEILIKLPNVARGKDVDNIREIMSNLHGLTGVYADNLYAIGIANEFSLKVLGGILLNLYNIDAVRVLGLTNYLISCELNASEMTEFDKDAYIFSFGYLPLMTLTHCPLMLNEHSRCCACLYRGVFTYSDNRETFMIRRTRNINCIFTLYNSKIHNIIAKASNLSYNNYISLVNTDYDVDSVVKAYIDKNHDFHVDNFTYGHLFRGVN